MTYAWSVERPLNDQGLVCLHRIGPPPFVEKVEGGRMGPPPAEEET
jgi:hypothetical protein